MLPGTRTRVMCCVVAIVTAMTLSGCVAPKRVGGFEISGIVLEVGTGTPIPGTRVVAYYSVTSAYGLADHPIAGETLSDEQGLFKINADRRTVIGGIGGWSGRTDKSPNLIFEKPGYCALGRMSGNPDDAEPPASSFSNLQIEMEKQTGSCGEAFSHR